MQLENLKVHAFHFVGHDEKWVQRTLWPARLLRVAFPRHRVALEAGLDLDVGNDSFAGPALNRDFGGLGLDAASGHDDAGNLDQLRDVIGGQVPDRGRVGL